jgi:hypothetical protein
MMAASLILVATVGITFALQARFAARAFIDRPVRFLLAACSLVVLLHPSELWATVACLPVLLLIGCWLVRHSLAAPAAEPRRR